MASIPTSDLEIRMLDPSVDLATFDCQDEDLNDFLKKDSKTYSERLLSKTYVAFYQRELVGYFTICADAIRMSKEERLEQFGKNKTHPDYPAVKIARLAVSSRFSHRGIGTYLVMEAAGKALALSRVMGCRFLAVDAYAHNAMFYEKKCNFVRNRGDTSGNHISMRLDLLDLQ